MQGIFQPENSSVKPVDSAAVQQRQDQPKADSWIGDPSPEANALLDKLREQDVPVLSTPGVQ